MSGGPAGPAPEARLRQGRALVSRRGARYLFYGRDGRQAAVFNAAAKRVWDQFAEPAGTGKVLRELARQGPFTPADVRNTLRCVGRFLDLGLLRRVTADPRERPPEPTPTVASPDDEPLRSLYLHVTDHCNLRCVYCYNADHRTANAGQRPLDAAELRALAEQAGALAVRNITFTGGEPLLRSETVRTARHARRLGIETTLLTNGTLLARNAAAVADAFDHTIVSLDSWRPGENEAIRIGGGLADIAAGIRALAQRGASVSVRPVITRFNVEALPGFPAFAAAELGVTRFQLALCSPSSGSEAWMYDLLPEPAAYRRARAGFYAALQRVDPGRGGGAPRARRALRCGAGTGMLSVAANGDVYPCQVLHAPGEAAGNLRRNSLEDIWRHAPRLDAFRRQVPRRFDACADCPIAELCGFNCRAIFASFADAPGDFTARMCQYARIDAEERLWREAERRLAQGDAAERAVPASPP